jgi:hypothetical protein
MTAAISPAAHCRPSDRDPRDRVPEPRGVTLAELAAALDAAKSSVQELTNGLLARGYLIEEERRFYLGPGPFILLDQLKGHAVALGLGNPGGVGHIGRCIALRRRLFALQQLWAAHSLMCATDGILAEALDEAAEQRRLRQAGGTFEASSAAAARAYALLGDTLTRQATLINERLTLVTVIFLPLTVISSFFGMNFGWMVDHIGSAASFVLLGIVLPLVVAAVTWVGARMLSGR